MAASRFAGLPTELHTAIASWLLRPSDLKNLCQASKYFCAVTVPILYHKISINVDQWPKDVLERFLQYGHMGHMHVRSLDVDSDLLDSETEALKIAKDALQVLPRNCLRSFRCALNRELDNDLMVLLSTQQRRLSFLGIGPLADNALNVPDSARPWPPSMHTIVIDWKIGGALDITFYRQLIERSGSALKALTVRTCSFGGSSGLLHRRDSEGLAKALFNYDRSKEHVTPLQLADLNLQNQDLRICKSIWIKHVDFSKLSTLQVWNCDNPGSLLRRLQDYSRRRPLRLHGLVLSFEDKVDLFEVQDFVGSLSSLQYLNLCYVPSTAEHSFFDVKCLESHKHTLKDLYLGIGCNNRTAHFNNQDFHAMQRLSSASLRWLCTDFTQLRQLAIALPPVSLEDVFTGQWNEYCNAIETLSTLPKLRILRILTLPKVNGRLFSNPGSNGAWSRRSDLYARQMDVVALSIVRHFSSLRTDDSTRLSVIMFGSAEQHDRVDHVDGTQERLLRAPLTYKVKWKETEFGSVLRAKRVEARHMEYEEPIAFVVDEDTDQGLSLEAYPWG